MKKRIICLILCVITLVSMFGLMSSAETIESEDTVLNGLKKISIDGKLFDEANYPLDSSDTEVYLLTLCVGTLSGSKKYYEGMYFYYYNPSGRKLENGDRFLYFARSSDRIVDDYKNFSGTSKYICTVERSEDNRFVRCFIPYDQSVGESYYYVYPKDFIDVETSQAVLTLNSRAFYLSSSAESDNITVTDGGIMELELELHGTVWRDENFASLNNIHEYQELATVYFTIPQDVYITYDRIWSVTADFHMFRSTPIIVSNSATLNAMDDVQDGFLSSGYVVSEYDPALPTLSYGKLQYWSDSNNAALYTAPEWVFNPGNGDRYNYEEFYPHKFKGQYSVFTQIEDRICYYFYNPDIKIDPDDNSFYQVLPSNNITAYVDQYSQFYYPDEYNTFVCGIAPELYESEDHYYLDFKYDDIYKMDTTVDVPDSERKWWEILFNLNKWQEVTEDVKKLLVIENPIEVARQYANDLDGLSEAYKIGRADASSFLEYLQKAEGVVTLVRFANNRYECRELEAKVRSSNVLGTDYYDRIDDGQTWLCRANFYQDVDVTKVTFERGGTLYEYKVNADSIDMDGGVGVKNDADVDPGLSIDSLKDAIDYFLSKGKRLFDKLKLVLGIIGIALVAALAIWLIFKIFRRRQKVKIEFIPPSDHKRRRK